LRASCTYPSIRSSCTDGALRADWSGWTSVTDRSLHARTAIRASHTGRSLGTLGASRTNRTFVTRQSLGTCRSWRSLRANMANTTGVTGRTRRALRSRRTRRTRLAWGTRGSLHYGSWHHRSCLGRAATSRRWAVLLIELTELSVIVHGAVHVVTDSAVSVLVRICG